MIATWVQARLTPLPFEDAARAMRSALYAELNAAPSLPCLSLALAKCALETARFRAIYLWNFGNVKAGETYVGQYCCIALNEVLRENGKDVVVWFDPRGRLDRKGGKVIAEAHADPPGHPQTRMRANVNMFDGAYRYVDFMVRGAGGRFASAFGFMRAGNAAGMVHEMKLRGYMTADEAPYLAGVASLQREFSLKLEGKSVDPVSFTDAEYESFRTFRNEELLSQFVEKEYAALQDRLNQGSGHALREYEEAGLVDDPPGGGSST